ncbi:MAG: hypothetical protein JW718_09575 [Desulfovibrionaceae bacterium]|nr:hypothetical protein [Desulfovibrionaceae bacterium]
MKDPCPNPGPRASALGLGLRVWASEIKWLAARAVRRYEIGRLEKRLGEEYGLLGRLEAGDADQAGPGAREFCLGQIGFLKTEIQALARDLEEASALRRRRLSDPGREGGGS